MYLEHFGLNEPPFRITPHTNFFFDGANRGATLVALIYAITHDEGIVKVSGEVGSGKTMLCRVLMERLPANREGAKRYSRYLDRFCNNQRAASAPGRIADQWCGSGHLRQRCGMQRVCSLGSAG
jgi:ABC-type phosphonate transport system ATPase subunit